LLGVRVSKEILQEELGIDPAVINNGEIGGGQALIGGGFQGGNANIRNARFTQIGRGTLQANRNITTDGVLDLKT